MRSRDDGFAVIETLVIVATLVIVCASGWYIYKNRQTATPATTVSNSDLNKLASQDKLTRYTNAQSNVEFYYPASWGSVKQDADQSDGSIAVDLHGLTFTFQDTSHPQRVSRSFQADSMCQYTSSTKSWVPAGEYPPTDCTPDAVVLAGTSVYGFNKDAEGVYGYSYCATLKDGRLLQVYSTAKDVSASADFPSQAEMDNVKQAAKDGAEAFIAKNSQLF